MKTIKKGDYWWVVDLPEGFEDCGPYNTKKEAEEDRKGMARCLESLDKRSFWTGDRRK